MKRLLPVLPFLVLLAGCGQPAEETFPSENISLVIPYGPGGGFDTTARLFAQYYSEALGGGITVLPQNVPGTGGRRGTTLVYRSEPDGYTLGIFNLPGLVLPKILGERIDYVLTDMSWIGRIELQDYALLVNAGSNIRSLDDLKAQDKVVFASIGYGTTVLAAIQIVAERLGLMPKNPLFLTGYTGTTEQLVAVIRGDGNVTMAPISTSEQYVRAGSLRPLAITGEGRSPVMPDVPTFGELGYPDLATLNVQRSIAGPPGMDPARLATLREAFDKVMADPRFREAAARAKMDLAPLDGERTAADIDASFTFYERYKDFLGNPNAPGGAAPANP